MPVVAANASVVVPVIPVITMVIFVGLAALFEERPLARVEESCTGIAFRFRLACNDIGGVLAIHDFVSCIKDKVSSIFAAQASWWQSCSISAWSALTKANKNANDTLHWHERYGILGNIEK